MSLCCVPTRKRDRALTILNVEKGVKHLVLSLTAILGSSIYSTVNKNPETDTGVQTEDQKNKAASPWFLPLPQSEMAILPTGISE